MDGASSTSPRVADAGLEYGFAVWFDAAVAHLSSRSCVSFDPDRRREERVAESTLNLRTSAPTRAAPREMLEDVMEVAVEGVRMCGPTGPWPSADVDAAEAGSSEDAPSSRSRSRAVTVETECTCLIWLGTRCGLASGRSTGLVGLGSEQAEMEPRLSGTGRGDEVSPGAGGTALDVGAVEPDSSRSDECV